MANSEQLIASASTALMGSLFDEIAIRRFVSSLVFISVSLPLFCSFFLRFFLLEFDGFMERFVSFIFDFCFDLFCN